MKIARGLMKLIPERKPTAGETKNQVILMGTGRYFGKFADLV